MASLLLCFVASIRDVCVDGVRRLVFVAMAGTHQIWTYKMKTGVAERFSGNGYERNDNGPAGDVRPRCSLARCAGLTS